MHYTYRNSDLNDGMFLIKNHGVQKKVEHFCDERKKNCKPRNLYPVKISVRNEGNVDIFLD